MAQHGYQSFAMIALLGAVSACGQSPEAPLDPVAKLRACHAAAYDAFPHKIETHPDHPYLVADFNYHARETFALSCFHDTG